MSPAMSLMGRLSLSLPSFYLGAFLLWTVFDTQRSSLGRRNDTRAVRIHGNGCTRHGVMWLWLVQHVALWFVYV